MSKKWRFWGIGILVSCGLILYGGASRLPDGLGESETKPSMFQSQNEKYYEDYQTYMNAMNDSIELVEQEVVVDSLYELSVDGSKIYYFESLEEVEEVLRDIVVLSTENISDIQVTVGEENRLETIAIDFEVKPIMTQEILERNFVMSSPSPMIQMDEPLVKETNEMKEVLVGLSFSEDVQIESVVKDGQVISKVADVVAELLKLNAEPAEYTIESGDSASVIAEKYNMGLSELYRLNPWLEDREQSLQIGDCLVVEKLIPELSVINCFLVPETDSIQPEVIYQEDDTLYKGLEVVSEEGQEGKLLLKKDVDILNDDVIAESVVESEVIEEATPQLVLVGTKPVPEDGPAGFFVSPLAAFRLTSSYGPRWGRTHAGIDMAVNTGTTVTAADGGQVIYSGWDSGYGYRIDIDHGNGVITRYGHNSKLLVEYGEIVGQGEVIAKSGNTGRSTGPHLHFEVRVDGTAMNPYDYIGNGLYD